MIGNLCTASIKGTRAAAAVPSSNVELWAFSRAGRGGGVRCGDGGLAGLRLQRVVVGLFLRLWTSLRPCRLSSSSLRCTCGWCLRSSSSTSASTSCFMVAYTHSANCALPWRSHRCCSWCLCAVVIQRLVPGRYSADYCEGSAVAVL